MFSATNLKLYNNFADIRLVVFSESEHYYLVLCPARTRLPARNDLVNEVEFLGLITQNG